MNKKRITPSIQGYLMILASALCFASYGVWSRLLGQHFGIFYQGFVRSTIILMILLPILILSKKWKPIEDKDR